MILTCEKCTTSYSVSDDAIGAEGRKVKCIGCGHVWVQMASDGDAPAEDAKPDKRAAKKTKDKSAIASRSAGAVTLAALLLLIGGLAAAIYAGRAAIVQSWPPAALMYEEFGIGLDGLDLSSIPGVGAGLEYRNVTSEVLPDAFGNTLWVRGEVHNASEIPRPVPVLRASLADAEGAALESWTFSLEVEMLQPGAAAGFETSRRSIADVGAKVVLGVDGPWPDTATAVSELAH